MILKYCSVIICSCFLLHYSLGENRTTLKQMHIVFRHGDRSPTVEKDPNVIWPGGLGQLTNKGKLQMYILGTKYREYYKDFINDYYIPDEVIFWSSYAERCLMSMELVNAGLFPPKGDQIWNQKLPWQPTPVKYLPRSQDNFVCMKQDCTKYDKLFKELVNSEKVKSILDENKQLIQLLNKNGYNITTLGQIEVLYDTFEIKLQNNITIPEWIDNDILKTMKNLAAKYLALFSDNTYMKRMKGGVLIKRILDSMKTFASGNKEPELYFYSGHDFTIVNLLRSLDLVDTIKPEFGASVIFQLHQSNNNNLIEIFYIKNFENEPEKQIIAGCENECTLEKFENLYKQILPENWEEECKVE